MSDCACVWIQPSSDKAHQEHNQAVRKEIEGVRRLRKAWQSLLGVAGTGKSHHLFHVHESPIFLRLAASSEGSYPG